MDKYHAETTTYPDAIAAISAELENAKAQFTGKSGRITELMKGLAALSVEEKKSRGAAINQAKQAIEAALGAPPAAIQRMVVYETLALMLLAWLALLAGAGTGMDTLAMSSWLLPWGGAAAQSSMLPNVRMLIVV